MAWKTVALLALGSTGVLSLTTFRYYKKNQEWQSAANMAVAAMTKAEQVFIDRDFEGIIAFNDL